MFEVDWGSVSVIGGLVAASFGYLSRQIHQLTGRLDGRMDRLEDKLDKLTERYIEHLERRH